MTKPMEPNQTTEDVQLVLARPLGFKLTAMLWLMVLGPLTVAMTAAYLFVDHRIEANALESFEKHTLEHQQVVDRFLAERTGDLTFISRNMSVTFLRQPVALEWVFKSLAEPIPGFVDLGVIDSEGKHLAYHGPYDLIKKNYREEPWFKEVMQRGQYVSDMFMGFREEPHVIVAVVNQSGKQPWILRATINGYYLDRVVTESVGSPHVTSFLVNREGRYQSLPPGGRGLMDESGLGEQTPFSGARVETAGGRVRARVWLTGAPWMLVHEIDREQLMAPLPLIRDAGLAIIGVTALLVLIAVTRSTGRTLTVIDDKKKQIEARDRRLAELDSLSCGIEVSSELASEIKDALLNIDLAARWVEDLAAKRVEPETAGEIRDSLDQIKSQSQRGRRLAEKFLDFIRTSTPTLMPVQINELIGEVIETMDREIIYHQIRLERELDERLGEVNTDPALLRQVLKNLLANAIMAVQSDAKISVKSEKLDGRMRISISDSGPGIEPDKLTRIFDPCFSAWPGRKGLGLGLSTCANVLCRLGGEIHADSVIGQGTVMTVELPL